MIAASASPAATSPAAISAPAAAPFVPARGGAVRRRTLAPMPGRRPLAVAPPVRRDRTPRQASPDRAAHPAPRRVGEIMPEVLARYGLTLQ